MGDNHKLLQMIAGILSVFKKPSLLCHKHWLQQEQECSLVWSCIYTIHKYLIRCSYTEETSNSERGKKGDFDTSLLITSWEGLLNHHDVAENIPPSTGCACEWEAGRETERRKGKPWTSWQGGFFGRISWCLPSTRSKKQEKEIIYSLLMTRVTPHSDSCFKGGAAAARETCCNWQPHLIFGVLENQ